MIKVREYRKGEEEALRQICRDTICRVNVLKYGRILVEKWAFRLTSNSHWRERLEKNNAFVAEPSFRHH